MSMLAKLFFIPRSEAVFLKSLSENFLTQQLQDIVHVTRGGNRSGTLFDVLVLQVVPWRSEPAVQGLPGILEGERLRTRPMLVYSAASVML